MKRAVPIILVLFLAAASGGWAQGKIPDDVVSLFRKKCAQCHKGKFPPQGLSWETAKIAAAINASSKEAPDLKIIDTASPESSYVLKKVRGESGIKGSRMPPPGALTTEEIKILETWIKSLKKLPVPASAGPIGAGTGPLR